MPSIKQRRRSKRRADNLVEEALEAADADHLHLAEKLIQRALTAGPANARFWLEFARIALRRGHTRRAERAVRRALELSPAYTEARELLAEMTPGEPRAPAVMGAGPVTDPIAGDIAGDNDEVCFTGRTERFDWSQIAQELTVRGLARLPSLLTIPECIAIRELYAADQHFEHDVSIDDARGRLAYRFFKRPLPELVVELRRELYARLAPVANHWNELIGDPQRWPASHASFQRACLAAGHGRTSPIVLRYEAGGFNGFHRDVYGSMVFPLQMATSLGPARLGDGGEFALVDVRPGKRKRVRVLATDLGDAVIFCTRDRLCPIAGLYGRQPVMHGAQEVRVERHVLGIPFHDYQG